MRNKMIKRLLMISVAFSMVFGAVEISSASNTTEESNDESIHGAALTNEDFIIQTEKPVEEYVKYNNNMMEALDGMGDSSYIYFFETNDENELLIETGKVTFSRDIILGESTRDDLLKAYGVGIENKFDSNTDIAFSGENYPQEYRSIMKEIEKTLISSITYNYKNLYQIIFFIDNENIIKTVYFLNDIFYTASKDDISHVQTMLNERGYNCGNPDGIIGKNTETAILQYQKDNGLFESGVVDDELLKSLSNGTTSINSNSVNTTETIGIPISTFIQRYNEAIDYYNAIATRDGYNEAVHITEENLKNEDYMPNGNLKITVNPNTTEKSSVGIINIWTDDRATLDENVATGEIMAMFYAFDDSMEEGSEALELWAQLNEQAQIQKNGITYDNYSFGDMIALKAQYDGFEIK